MTNVQKHLAGQHDQQTHAGKEKAGLSKEEKKAALEQRVLDIMKMPELRHMLSDPGMRQILYQGSRDLARRYTADELRRDAVKIKKANETLASVKSAAAGGIQIASIPVGVVMPIVAHFAVQKAFMWAGLKSMRGQMGDALNTEDVLEQRENLERKHLDDNVAWNKMMASKAGVTAVGLMGAMYAAQSMAKSVKNSAARNTTQAIIANQVVINKQIIEAMNSGNWYLSSSQSQPTPTSKSVYVKNLSDSNLAELESQIREFLSSIDYLASVAEEQRTAGKIDAKDYDAIKAMRDILKMYDPYLNGPSATLKHLAGRHDQITHGHPRNKTIMGLNVVGRAERLKRRELAEKYATFDLERNPRLVARIKRSIQVAGIKERKDRENKLKKKESSAKVGSAGKTKGQQKVAEALGGLLMEGARFLLTNPVGQELLAEGVRAGGRGVRSVSRETGKRIEQWNDPYKDDPYKQNYPKAHWWHEDTRADVERKRKQAKVRDYVREMARQRVPIEQWNPEYRELAKLWRFAKSSVASAELMVSDISGIIKKSDPSVALSSQALDEHNCYFEIRPEKDAGLLITIAESAGHLSAHISKSKAGRLTDAITKNFAEILRTLKSSVSDGLVDQVLVSTDLEAPINLFDDWSVVSNRLDKSDIDNLLFGIRRDKEYPISTPEEGRSYRAVSSSIPEKKSKYLSYASQSSIQSLLASNLAYEWAALLRGTDIGKSSLSYLYEKHMAGQHDQQRHAGLGDSFRSAGDAAVRLGKWANKNPGSALAVGMAVAGAATALGDVGSKVARRLEVARQEWKEEGLKKKLHQTIRNEFTIGEYLKRDKLDARQQDWALRASAHKKYFTEVQHSKNLQRKDLIAFHRDSTSLVAEAQKLFGKVYVPIADVDINRVASRRP